MFASRINTRSLGAAAPLVPHARRLHRLPSLVPLYAKTMKKAGGSVMPEWSSGWEGLEDPWLDAKHQYHLRLVLTKETLSSPDGDVLRYIADEVYKQLFCSKVGPKPDSQTWSDYVTETCVCKHRTWFRKHGIGYPEMAMLVKVLDADTCQAGHNAAPRPPAEVANALVRKLGEEWEALWAPVRLSD